MSSERQRERVLVHRAAGKQFQMTGPATTKLLIPSVVVVRGMDSNPVRVDRRCLLQALAEIARQSSAKYVGANSCRHRESPCIVKMLHYSAVVSDSFHVYVYYFMFLRVLQSGCRYVCV